MASLYVFCALDRKKLASKLAGLAASGLVFRDSKSFVHPERITIAAMIGNNILFMLINL
jgi:hypothetical protein